MTGRLFHTIVMVGAALGASSFAVACGGSEEGSSTTDTGGASDTGKVTPDTAWPSIGYVGDSWSGIRPYDPDTGVTDTSTDGRSDAPTDAADAKDGETDAVPDTGWPGISPAIDAGRP